MKIIVVLLTRVSFNTCTANPIRWPFFKNKKILFLDGFCPCPYLQPHFNLCPKKVHFEVSRGADFNEERNVVVDFFTPQEKLDKLSLFS